MTAENQFSEEKDYKRGHGEGLEEECEEDRLSVIKQLGLDFETVSKATGISEDDFSKL